MKKKRRDTVCLMRSIAVAHYPKETEKFYTGYFLSHKDISHDEDNWVNPQDGYSSTGSGGCKYIKDINFEDAQALVRIGIVYEGHLDEFYVGVDTRTVVIQISDEIYKHYKSFYKDKLQTWNNTLLLKYEGMSEEDFIAKATPYSKIMMAAILESMFIYSETSNYYALKYLPLKKSDIYRAMCEDYVMYAEDCEAELYNDTYDSKHAGVYYDFDASCISSVFAVYLNLKELLIKGNNLKYTDKFQNKWHKNSPKADYILNLDGSITKIQ